jgi:hypothetical protein
MATILSVGALAERLAFLWHINKYDSNPDLLLGGGQHFDRVAIDNTRYARADRLLLQVAGVRGGLWAFLAENGKSTKEKEQGDEFGVHEANRFTGIRVQAFSFLAALARCCV